MYIWHMIKNIKAFIKARDMRYDSKDTAKMFKVNSQSIEALIGDVEFIGKILFILQSFNKGESSEIFSVYKVKS